MKASMAARQLRPHLSAIELAAQARAPRKAPRGKTIEQIIHIAIDLFDERGYDHVTVDEIAAAVEVPKRSLYRHFRQKDEFLVRWMLRVNEQICASLAGQPPDLKPLHAFRCALNDVEEIRSAQAKRLVVLHRITSQSPAARSASVAAQLVWEDRIVEVLKRRSHRVGAEVDGDLEMRLRVIAATCLVALRTAVGRWAELPPRQATRPSLARILDVAFATVEEAAD